MKRSAPREFVFTVRNGRKPTARIADDARSHRIELR